MDQPLPQQINFQEQIKNDKFNILWKNNFKTNFVNKEFEKFGRYGIQFVSMRVKKENLHPSCFLVNPGPSLEKNIDILKEIYIEKKGVIITSDVCLYRLLDEGIIPDIVCTIDPDESISRFWKGYMDQVEETILIAPTTCAPLSIQTWTGPIVFFNQRDRYEWRNEFFKKITKKTRSYGSFLNLTFVGGTLLQTAVLLNAENIFLVGWDFSSDAEGNIYCKNFLEKRIFTTIKNKDDILNDKRFEREDHQEIKKELLEGNWETGVKMFKLQLKKEQEEKQRTLKLVNKADNSILWTNQHYLFYKSILIKMILPDVRTNIFNCTEGGILEEIQKIKLIDSKNISTPLSKKIVYNLFTSYDKNRTKNGTSNRQ